MPSVSGRRRHSRATRLGVRQLRRTATRAEQTLRRYLRNRGLGVKFRRQHPLDQFVVDFCCVEARLVVEIDGDIHSGPDQSVYDEVRTEKLVGLGYQIVRFTNVAVQKDLGSVLDAIRKALSPSPALRETMVP